MPEPPDFDQIALELITMNTARAQVAIIEQLRQVWNARGAADAERLANEWRDGLDVAPALRAIRTLDR